MRPVSALTATAAALLSVPAAAQTALRLDRPRAEFPEPFTQVSAVRELPGGRVLVADRPDKVVQILDLASGTAVKVGREGQGPGEYAMPAGLVPLPGGHTLLMDPLARRFLEIGPDGRTGATVGLPAIGGGPGGGIAFFGDALGDGRGGVYLQAPPFTPGNPEATPDSVPILRWNRAGAALDTVAFVGVPRATVQTSGRSGQFTMRIGGGRVFEPQEAWGVAGDGAVARVLPAPYRVVWYPAGGGRPVAGPEVAWTPLRVTEADRRAVIEERRRARPGVVSFSTGGGRAQAPPNVSLPEPEFADTKPPFGGQGAVVVSPEGEVWVRKHQPAGARNPEYDVFDRAGRLVRKVTLNPRSRVVGFGQGAVYVVRTDDDDLQYLQRFAR
jgi:hypothetical protein